MLAPQESVSEPRAVMVDLPSRGGAVHLLEWRGPEDAPTILFMQANGFNAGTYQRILGPLSTDYNVIAFDMRGNGRSTLPTNVKRLRNWHIFRDDLVALHEALRLKDVILGGHSIGGTVSVLAAQAQPTIARGLVLLDPVLLPTMMGAAMETFAVWGLSRKYVPFIRGTANRRAHFPDAATMLDYYRGRGVFRTWPDDILADYIAHGTKTLPDGALTLACTPDWEASIFESHAHNVWRNMRRITCPVAVLRAAKESTLHPAMASRLKRFMPHAHITTLPGTTHMLPMETPAAVRDAFAQVASARR